MSFRASAFRQWIQEHNSKDSEEDFKENVLREIEDEDYPIAAYELNRCRLPVGLSGLAECLDGAVDEGMSKLYRVWRYLAYEMHIDQTEGDWIQGQIDAGQTPEYDIPTVNMEYGCYSLAGAIVFDEDDFAHWAGKRLLAYYMKPDLRPLNLDGGAMILFTLSLFLYWLLSKGAAKPTGMDGILIDLKSECKGPHKKVLADWGDDKRFATAFKALCDHYGDFTGEPIPFNGFPVLILATRKIRMDLGLSVPEHLLLEEPVCKMPEAAIDRSDPFFDKVDKLMVEITPTDAYKWPW